MTHEQFEQTFLHYQTELGMTPAFDMLGEQYEQYLLTEKFDDLTTNCISEHNRLCITDLYIGRLGCIDSWFVTGIIDDDDDKKIYDIDKLKSITYTKNTELEQLLIDSPTDICVNIYVFIQGSGDNIGTLKTYAFFETH